MSTSTLKIIEIKDLYKNFKISRSFRSPLLLKALRGVSLNIYEGKTLAIVGESGCGKSTLAKTLMKLETPSSGNIKVGEKNLEGMSSQNLSSVIQMVFQDPSSSLNPRKKVFDLIAEPLVVQNQLSRSEIQNKVYATCQSVGLNQELIDRYPHMMSGGQRQRVGIARALVTQPKVLILDEPVSALDVSIQAQVLNLLLDLKVKNNLSYIFISHDLSVVRFIADEVAVLYLGKIVEKADKNKIFKNPLHPYTQLLLKSSPKMGADGNMTTEKTGELPSPLNPPPGCAFSSRCPKADAKCLQEDPELKFKNERFIACHHVDL
jgi:dipeptide transport system ATP-binding protein